MKRLIIGTLTAVASYITVKKLTQPDKPKLNVTWISAEEAEPEAEAEERPDEILPMFYIGDSVNKYDPHMGALYYEYEDEGPAYYEITDVRYDDEDEVFRYNLDGNELDWISEDWLSLPMSTKFSKRFANIERGGDEMEKIPEMVDAERKLLEKSLDESARQTQIDFLLDRMNSGTEAERAEAERQLAKIMGSTK